MTILVVVARSGSSGDCIERRKHVLGDDRVRPRLTVGNHVPSCPLFRCVDSKLPRKEREMADEDTPLPPVEIPWKLAATTQPLSAGEPAETALSLFFFEPDDETLTGLFPDEKLVFVKFTATISPASFPPELSRVAASFLGEGIPCLHVLLDLKVRGDDDAGTIRPYFHAAAPLDRRMVQTGVVGSEIYEGEADGVAIGKSGSQVNETLRSHSDTVTKSGSAGLNLGLISLGGSVR